MRKSKCNKMLFSILLLISSWSLGSSNKALAAPNYAGIESTLQTYFQQGEIKTVIYRMDVISYNDDYTERSAENILGIVSIDSSNPSVATVDSSTGILTAHQTGTTVLSATYNEMPWEHQVYVSNLVVTPSVSNVSVGEVKNYIATFYNWDGEIKDVTADAVWRTNDTISGPQKSSSKISQDKAGSIFVLVYYNSIVNYYANAVLNVESEPLPTEAPTPTAEPAPTEAPIPTAEPTTAPPVEPTPTEAPVEQVMPPIFPPEPEPTEVPVATSSPTNTTITLIPSSPPILEPILPQPTDSIEIPEQQFISLPITTNAPARPTTILEPIVTATSTPTMEPSIKDSDTSPNMELPIAEANPEPKNTAHPTLIIGKSNNVPKISKSTLSHNLDRENINKEAIKAESKDQPNVLKDNHPLSSAVPERAKWRNWPLVVAAIIATGLFWVILWDRRKNKEDDKRGH